MQKDKNLNKKHSNEIKYPVKKSNENNYHLLGAYLQTLKVEDEEKELGKTHLLLVNLETNIPHYVELNDNQINPTGKSPLKYFMNKNKLIKVVSAESRRMT